MCSCIRRFTAHVCSSVLYNLCRLLCVCAWGWACALGSISFGLPRKERGLIQWLLNIRVIQREILVAAERSRAKSSTAQRGQFTELCEELKRGWRLCVSQWCDGNGISGNARTESLSHMFTRHQLIHLMEDTYGKKEVSVSVCILWDCKSSTLMKRMSHSKYHNFVCPVM